MEFCYGKIILIKNWQESNNVPFASISWIAQGNCLRKDVRHVRRSSIVFVSWNGLAKVIKASVLFVNHNSYDTFHNCIYILLKLINTIILFFCLFTCLYNVFSKIDLEYNN